MNTIKKAKIALFVLFASLMAVSCNPETQSIGDAGTTFVKLSPEEFSLVAMNASPTSQTGILFEIRKDVANQADLNTPTTVEVVYDAALLVAYNAANETEFIPLPTTLGTISPALVSGKITVSFAAGEFSKAVTITVPDATKFDFTKKYALAFKITTVSGSGKISKAYTQEVIAQVLIKNKYDGKYEVKELSPMVDVTNAGLTGYYPFTFELETSGENSVTCLLTDPGYYTYYHPITSGGSASAYGGFGLEIFFDPATGKIIDVKNPWGNPPSNTRMPKIDPSGVNKYDAATKTIMFKYWMIQPSVVTTPPNIRVFFDEKWTYKGAR